MQEFKSLTKLSEAIRYCQEALAITSGFLLMLGLVYSMTNVLTEGLLNRIPGAEVAWAISQAVAVDANLLLTWARAARAYRAKQWAEFWILVAIGTVLMLVAGAGTYLESLQTQGETLAQATSSIGLSLQLIVLIRSGLVAALAALIGWSYFAFPISEQPGKPTESKGRVVTLIALTKGNQEQAQKIQEAYTRLVEQEGADLSVSVDRLQAEAGVRREVVSEWLEQARNLSKSNGHNGHVTTTTSTV